MRSFSVDGGNQGLETGTISEAYTTRCKSRLEKEQNKVENPENPKSSFEGLPPHTPSSFKRMQVTKLVRISPTTY